MRRAVPDRIAERRVCGAGSIAVAFALGACSRESMQTVLDASDAGSEAAVLADDAVAPLVDAAREAGRDGRPPPRCGDGQIDLGEACDDGNEDRFDGCLPDCTLTPTVSPTPGQWTYVQVPGTQCLDGSTAGFGVITNPASQNLMIYLEGGGACFSDSCDFMSFSIPFVPPPDGIFNRNNAANPVRDWNVVYVPYCSGDLHAGNADTMLGGRVRTFRGYTNLTRYLERVVPSFPRVTQVLLTGISAGGFGAGLNIEQVSRAFGPARRMVMVDDSGPPLAAAALPPCLQARLRSAWGLDRTFLADCGADCTDPNDFGRGWLRHLALRFPDLRTGIYSNTHDTIIRTFLGAGWCDGQYNHCSGVPTSIPPDVYQNDLLDIRSTYGTRISSFYVGASRLLLGAGLWHTVLRSPTFYVTNVDGTSVPAWLRGVIDGTVRHVGP